MKTPAMEKNHYRIEITNLAKMFSSVSIFTDINAAFSSGMSCAITGPNGSGKSTLLEVVAGIKRPSQGAVDFILNDVSMEKKYLWNHIGFVSPRINLYNELSGLENIEFVTSSHEGNYDITAYFKRFDLFEQKEKQVGHYSTGMKQRLKIIAALVRDPGILLLDEPSSNLDGHGKELLLSYLGSVREEKIIIIATNDEQEARFCNEVIRLG